MEILSLHDTLEDVEEKIDAFLKAGVPLIWVINPRRKTITVYRTSKKPELFNEDQDIHDEPILPGFQIPVAKLFG